MSLMLGPDDGERIQGGGLDATLKVAGGPDAVASTFTITVPPGYDVGAHVHTRAQELFFVLEGELDILAFEPVDRSVPDWHAWTSRTGQRFLRGGPGSVLQVPAAVPHAFANPGDRPARFLFQQSPAGHEHYFHELAEILRRSDGRPDPDEIAALRLRHDIHQITTLSDGRTRR